MVFPPVAEPGLHTVLLLGMNKSLLRKDARFVLSIASKHGYCRPFSTEIRGHDNWRHHAKILKSMVPFLWPASERTLGNKIRIAAAFSLLFTSKVAFQCVFDLLKLLLQ